MFLADPSFGMPYPFILAGLPDAMERMGLPVVRLDTSTLTLADFREQAAVFKPDLIFCCIQYQDQIIKTAGFLREYHPTVATNWFTEDPNATICTNGSPTALLKASKDFDIWFTINPRMTPYWRTKAVFMPPGFNDVACRDENLPRTYDVSYVGQLGHALSTDMYWPYMKTLATFGRRAALCIERPMGLPKLPYAIERLVRHRVVRRHLRRLPIWRCSWGSAETEASRERIISRSKIHFGLSRVRGHWEEAVLRVLPDYLLDEHGYFYQVKGRLFHAVGTATMALNDHFPELEEMFTIGKEIVAFQFGDIQDLRQKLEWYTKHDNERLRIARAGYERGRKEHTLGARVNQIIAAVNRLV
jgi:hypothetical protein